MAFPKVGEAVWLRPGENEGLDCEDSKPLAALVASVRLPAGPNDPAILNVAAFDRHAQLRPLGSVPFYDTGAQKPGLGSMTFCEWPS